MDKQQQNKLDNKMQKLAELLFEHEFYCSLFMQKPLIYDDKIDPPTMCTNGEQIKAHPDFIQNTKLSSLLFVACHEAAHIAAGHSYRMGDRNPKIWNIACDIVINYILALELPIPYELSPVIDRRFDGMTEEKIYDKLLKDAKSSAKSVDNYVDSIYSTDRVKTGEVEKYTLKKGESTQSKLDELSVDIEQIKTISKMANSKEISSRVADHINLLERSSKMNWRYELEKFVNGLSDNDYTYKRINKRYISHDLFLPSNRDDDIVNLVIAFDTSDSMTSSYNRVLSHMDHIQRLNFDLEITVIQCDTHIQSITHHSALSPNRDKIKNLKIRGGGGTDPQPVFNYIRTKKDIDGMLFFTDMEFPPFPLYINFEFMWCNVKPQNYDKVLEYYSSISRKEQEGKMLKCYM